ncbi:MAG: 50S ribosomal protein L4 [Candidatus Omnitrophota bacterium]
MDSKFTINIIDKFGKNIDAMQIDDKIWGQEINEDLLHRAVVTSLANKRAGTASTKTRKYVSGGGRKPWRQKGTGRARAGSIRSPLWRGGGVVFGPHPRDFACALPKKMRRKALINSLVLKLNENKLTVIDDIKIEKPKTKEMIALLKRLNVDKEKSLLVVKTQYPELKMSARNINTLQLANVKDLNIYDVLNNANVIFTKEAFLEVGKGINQ